MPSETEALVERLLRETNAAHGEHETTVLGGVYDEEWPAWYATYLIDHGLQDVTPGSENLDVGQLGAILQQLDTDYRREGPDSEWPIYYAERFGAKVREFGSDD
ncbi:hypothetical protein BH09CHL1_BH09CHL1_36540 [soil metagenome]